MSYLYDDEDYYDEFEEEVTHGGLDFLWKDRGYYIDDEISFRVYDRELKTSVHFETLQLLIDNFILHDGTPFKALLDGTIPRPNYNT